MKHVALLITLTLTALLSVASAQDVTVEFWSSLCGSKEAAREDMLSTWAEQHPDITVEHLAVCDIYENNQKVITTLAGGSPPELVSNHYYFIPQYADLGALEPLDACLEEAGIDPASTFLPTTYDLNVFDGQLYGLPLFNTSRVLLYNKDLFEEAGLDPEAPPATWEELVSMAETLTKRSADGALEVSGFLAQDETVSAEITTNMFYQLLWSLGGEIMNEDKTEVVYNSEAGVRALQLYVDLIQTDRVYDIGFGAGTTGGEQPFYRDQAAMIMAGPFDLVFIEQFRPDMDFGVALLPAPEGGAPAPLIDSFALFMMAGAANQGAACEFVKFAATPEAQTDFALLSRRLPAHVGAVQDPAFQDDPVLSVFIDALNQGRALPIIPEWAEMEAALITELQLALSGEKSPQEALDTAAEKVNSRVLQ